MPIKNGYLAAGAVAAGLVVAGGLSAASATTGSATTTPGYGYNQRGGEQGGQRQAPHQHTAVTGAEADKVKAAVKAKDSTITVNSVQKDPDGSYDVFGTKSGSNVMVEVSKDLATVTVKEGRGGRDGGRSMHQHTAVTGAEADKVEAAVKAKDSAVTVTKVEKDPDGSYDVTGTKAGAEMRYDVSKDLQTITERVKGNRDGRGPRGGEQGGQQAPAPSQSASPSQSTGA